MAKTNNEFRDERGLLKGINYVFREDGKVDWRKMLKPEHLALNKDVFKKKGVDVSTLSEEEINELKTTATDRELIILLNGINYLAELRGFEKVEHRLHPHPNGISCECHITWIPNFESEMRTVTYSKCAGATLQNTQDLAARFLDTIADNRAFVRAVRFFLGLVNLVAFDELGENNQVIPDDGFKIPTPQTTLDSWLKKAGISFDKFKEGANKRGFDTTNWNCIDDVPAGQCFSLIAEVKQKIEEKKKK